jgi:hypothetical protein
MSNNLRVLKSQGLAFAIKTATGENPTVTEYPDYSELTFDEDQVKRLKTKLRDALKPGAPGDVRVDLAPVVVPVVLEKVAPIAIIGIVGIYLLGRYKVLF